VGAVVAQRKSIWEMIRGKENIVLWGGRSVPRDQVKFVGCRERLVLALGGPGMTLGALGLGGGEARKNDGNAALQNMGMCGNALVSRIEAICLPGWQFLTFLTQAAPPETSTTQHPLRLSPTAPPLTVQSPESRVQKPD
jgi:hypothetical protein